MKTESGVEGSFMSAVQFSSGNDMKLKSVQLSEVKLSAVWLNECSTVELSSFVNFCRGR